MHIDEGNSILKVLWVRKKSRNEDWRRPSGKISLFACSVQKWNEKRRMNVERKTIVCGCLNASRRWNAKKLTSFLTRLMLLPSHSVSSFAFLRFSVFSVRLLEMLKIAKHETKHPHYQSDGKNVYAHNFLWLIHVTGARACKLGRQMNAKVLEAEPLL